MGEADVAVDAVNAVLDSEAAHVGEILGDACDETLHVLLPRSAQGVIHVLVGLEPRSIVIDSQLAQKGQNF